MAHSSPWIHMSPSLKRGVTLLNKIDGKKFLLLVNRIILEMKQNPSTMSVITEDEREKLSENFSMGKDEIELIISSCIAIISQAVYNVTSPDKLKILLRNEMKLDEDKSLAFANVWSSSATGLILKVKQKSVFSTQLEDVSWLMNLEIASQSNTQTFIPKALLQLKLKEGEGTSNMNLDLDEKDLYVLNNALDNIQGALDSLG